MINANKFITRNTINSKPPSSPRDSLFKLPQTSNPHQILVTVLAQRQLNQKGPTRQTIPCTNHIQLLVMGIPLKLFLWKHVETVSYRPKILQFGNLAKTAI